MQTTQSKINQNPPKSANNVHKADSEKSNRSKSAKKQLNI